MLMRKVLVAQCHPQNIFNIQTMVVLNTNIPSIPMRGQIKGFDRSLNQL